MYFSKCICFEFVQIYQGLTEELSLFTQTYTDTYTDNQTVEVPYFQATIKLYCDKQADRPTFQGLLIEKGKTMFRL